MAWIGSFLLFCLVFFFCFSLFFFCCCCCFVLWARCFDYDLWGVFWEALQLLDELYRNFEAGLDRILPVVLPGISSKDVPPFLLIADYYTITDFSLSGSESLLRVLTGQPAEITPPLGAAPTLEPRPSERNGRRRLAKIRKGLAAAWSLTCWAARAFRRAITAINRFIERISNWFFWAVGGGILPLLCTWALNVKEESNLEELLGSGELFIVSAVLVAATYGELLREGKRSKEASKIDGPKPAIKEVGWKAAWPSQGRKFACFASAVGAIAGYGGVSTNGAQVTTYLSISVFAFTLVTGAAVMNGIERDE